MLFHSFVDEKREAYVIEHGFYEQLPKFKFITQALKCAEDEILKSYCNCADYAPYFDEIIEAEMRYNIQKDYIKIWHLFLQEYLTANSSIKNIMMKHFDLMYPNAWRVVRQLIALTYMKKMQNIVLFIMQNKKLKWLILNFYMNFIKEVVK